MSDKYGDSDAAQERDMDREVEDWLEQHEDEQDDEAKGRPR